ncbi:glycosyltransferase family 2 protein [Sphingobacterium sp. SGG-5]|uniref:glycosyltransferase family 2 protein n=1 Tax=Sphingobacterium sp. SGG-5 TaxID=2710881 RepID=UPI0013EA011D|nr:glycosyltransferase [Sphingobacterium sp. SGG-5]NGM61374.1 glycosyltransferase family 2 protein [Sphingobacterium sp. SGG-5]
MKQFVLSIDIFFGIYCMLLFLVYLMLFRMSLLSIRQNLQKKAYRRPQTLVESEISPGISIIAPAYNESITIVNNVRSLMTLFYPRYEVVIVNDGSKDDTLQKLIDEFDLIPIDFAVDYLVPCKEIKSIYKSKDISHKRLTVVDKVNGGSKADAVNAGINVSAFPYILNTDVDCVLANDTLTRLMEAVLDAQNRVIAVGATLRMSNSSYIDSGTLVEAALPEPLLARFQEMEYIRSYLLGKMGWNYLNCIPNVSGGLGLFDKEILIASGGYDPKSLGEDMEMITRMCITMCDNNQKYEVKYIPQTLCWTEGPDSLRMLIRQRVRWARGLMQIIRTHRKVFFNPEYKRFGMIVFPYNTIFEFLAPIVEVLGIFIYIYLISIGHINTKMALLLLGFVYVFSVFLTSFSILLDNYVFKYYNRRRDIVRLCITAFLEPFLYHPLIVYSSLKGYVQELFGKKHAWGEMERKGITNNRKNG